MNKLGSNMSVPTNSSDALDLPKTYIDLESFSSPSQQVPQISHYFNRFSCGAEYNEQLIHGNGPSLRIIEEPQNRFRFRYKSELAGAHGCLLGVHSTNKNKTYPTVELINYSGKALIKCRLADENCSKEHPHKLLDEEQDRDVSKEVPEDGSYKVAFPGLGIINTVKNEVIDPIYNSYTKTLQSFNCKELRARCKKEAENINFNVVRLMFTAEDVTSGVPVCSPVFSVPIKNQKSPATNDLKICKISRIYGKPRGGDDVFILVEKVNKKNIEIHFYGSPEDNPGDWSAKAKFLQSSVHHQYAIVFSTPPYKDVRTPVDVKVYVRLVRPSDGLRSEPIDFTYKAEEVFKLSKKRKIMPSCSFTESLSGYPKQSYIPHYNQQQSYDTVDEYMNDTEATNFGHGQDFSFSSINPLEVSGVPTADVISVKEALGPMLGQPNILGIQPSSSLTAELEVKNINNIPQESTSFMQLDLSEYLLDVYGISKGFAGYDALSPDSAKRMDESELWNSTSKENNDKNIKCDAAYDNEDRIEVTQIVKDICEIIRNKKIQKLKVKAKLKRLFELRMSNGDTFLHLTLCNNTPSLVTIVKIIHIMKMINLLNLTNHHRHSILHLAVIHDLPYLVKFLVAKGCDPMLRDTENNTIIHIAVTFETCLSALLEAIKGNDVPCNLDAYNNDQLTALHLAVMYNSSANVRLLLEHGAAYSMGDSEGRTPLHLAVLNDRLDVVQVLMDFVTESDIDAVDKRGFTALQMACDSANNSEALPIIILLLQKQASPFQLVSNNRSAWNMVRDKPDIVKAMRDYLPLRLNDDEDVESVSADEYDATEEGVIEVGLQEMSLSAHELGDTTRACKLSTKEFHSE